MAERIEPLPGAPRAMPPLSFLHSILRLMVGLPDTPSEVLPRAPPRLPLRHTPSLDRASPQPTPSFKSEPTKRICLPGSAADPTLVEGLISGPDSLRWRLTRSLTVDDANSRSPATAMLAIQEGQLQEVVAESQLRPVVMAMTPAQLHPYSATVTDLDPLPLGTELVLGIVAGIWGIAASLLGEYLQLDNKILAQVFLISSPRISGALLLASLLETLWERRWALVRRRWLQNC